MWDAMHTNAPYAVENARHLSAANLSGVSLLVESIRRQFQAGAKLIRPSADSGTATCALMVFSGLLPFMAGCTGAPTITLAGAYFPAWLLCAIFAVFVAIVVHILMIVTKLSDRIPFGLAVCASLGVIAALVLWRLWEH
jgi:hypothetical protein